MASEPPKVLISYSHDSPEHRDRVLVLSKRLREEGVDSTIDQYLLVPPEGWPRWMEKQIRDSDFVVMVCTETYYRRVLGEEDPGRGRGVRWEGHLVYEAIYQADTRNTKFIPVLFEGGGLQWIPPVLQSTSYYDLSSEDGYEDLYRRLTNQSRADKPELGKLRSLPVKERRSEGASGRLVNVPSLPTHFVPRQEALQALKDPLLTGLSNPVALTCAGKIGVQGMGGIGKSVLAAALAHDDEMRHAFPDGVIWITLGQTPGNLTARQAQLAEALGESVPAFADVQHGKSRLSALLEGRGCLIILDDVWHLKHVMAFAVLGERGRLVLTTRDTQIVTDLGAVGWCVDPLTEPEALTLLAQWSGSGDPERLPEVAKGVAKECGYLPLALAMAGARVQGDPQGWANVLHRLRHADLAKLRGQFPDYPYEDLLKAIEASVEALALEGLRDRYLDLAVFPEDVPIPEATVCAFWGPVGMNEYDVQDALRRLVNFSLLRRDDQSRFTLHDLQHDYVRNEGVRKQAGVESVSALHGRFLEAYAGRCTKGWPSGPKDGYYFEHLPWHLKAAGRTEELKQLLCNFEWLQRKLEATDTNALIADYDYLTEEKDLRTVQIVLRQAAHILAGNPRELPGQLVGRLPEGLSQDIDALLSQASEHKDFPWLRPVSPSLTPLAASLVRTLQGHTSRVSAVAVTPDGRHAVSGSYDTTLRVWDLATGETKTTLQGHTGWVHAVAVTPDGRHVVSGSDDNTLRVWDLKDEKEILTFTVDGQVTACIVAQDNRTIVAGDGFGRLHFLRLVAADKTKPAIGDT
jgi:NB-ARC domain/TIR domain/APAF-1 helical domain/WD domain, G-beta repeat